VQKGEKMRLCNPKTKKETGFEYVVNALRILTPYGRKRVAAVKAFGPGQEVLLRNELNRLGETIDILDKNQEQAELIQDTLAGIKDNTFTIERSSNNTLSVVELYEIKTLLIQMERIGEYLNAIRLSGGRVPIEFQLLDLKSLLNTLDPGEERINTFYIYDSFSDRLADLRKKKRQIELDIRKAKKEQKCRVETKYSIVMTPKFEYMVAKADKLLIERTSKIPELALVDEDYMTAVFSLKNSGKVDEMVERMEEINTAIDEEELVVRERLSHKIGDNREDLIKNCGVIGKLDFNFAKANFSRQNNCTKPEIADDHLLKIQEGRQLMLEHILKKKNENYCPVSIELDDGVTCITGANMGGKTITLKMIGQCVLLAQHGFFLPCTRSVVGLSGYIHILVGDSQNIQRGLSSFGSEMEELKDIFDRSKNRSLLLIDEIASGTNPIEGWALTRSVINYLCDKPYMSLITTHFDNVSIGDKIRNLQVRGLANVNFENLSREIRYANRKERIEIISKYMDYRLAEVYENMEIPKDALNIAQMLGINRDIIELARKFMEDRKDE